MVINDYVMKKLLFVFGAIGPTATHWVKVKTILVNSMDNNHRRLFSRRHEIFTNQHQTNEYEFAIIAKWKELGGKDLILPPQHDPTTFVPNRGRGYGFKCWVARGSPGRGVLRQPKNNKT